MPLIDRGTMRYKLSRLATALAVRTFSVENGKVIVRPCHIDFIADFLKHQYSSSSFGYKDFSIAQDFANKVLDPDTVEKQIKSTKYPRDLVAHLLHANEITLIDLCDWCELSKEDGQRLLSLLVRKHALYRDSRAYCKSIEFISLLKRMKDKGLPESGQPDGKERF